MATNLYVATGTVGNPKPTGFVNPFGHTTGTPTTASPAPAYPPPVELSLTTNLPNSSITSTFGRPGTAAFYTIIRAYSAPLSGNQTIASQTITCTVSGQESTAQDNAEWEVDMFVWKADNSGSRGNIGHTNGSFPEMSNTAIGDTSGTFTSTSVSALSGDRICVEVYFDLTTNRSQSSDVVVFNGNTAGQRILLAFPTSTLVFGSEPVAGPPMGTLGLLNVGR